MGQLALKQQALSGQSGGQMGQPLDTNNWWINQPGLDFDDPDTRRKAGIFMERARRMEEYLRSVFGFKEGGDGEGLAYALQDERLDEEDLPMWVRPMELLLELFWLNRRFEGFNPQATGLPASTLPIHTQISPYPLPLLTSSWERQERQHVGGGFEENLLLGRTA